MFLHKISLAFEAFAQKRINRIIIYILGLFSLPFVTGIYGCRKKGNKYGELLSQTKEELAATSLFAEFLREAQKHSQRKCERFGYKYSRKLAREDERVARRRFNAVVQEKTATKAFQLDVQEVTLCSVFADLINGKIFFGLSLILSPFFYLWLLIYQYPLGKYFVRRVAMMVFVVFGVVFLVFTILFISPQKPAENLLGEQATQEQLDNFNAIYGLDKPYAVQLGRAVRNIVTFDLGKSFKGNEEIAFAISQKFPTTFRLSVFSLIVSLAIAIPAGIVSAIKQYSSWDYILMFLALLGLSIPNFWLGLILILTFAINLHWLPAIFVPGRMVCFVMPAIVLGTGLSAAVARMTRSSILEVKNADFIVTARAKGLSNKDVIMRHILKNAMIPILTVVGLQFGWMLGGAAVVEKVFNMNGLGSYIVDKQFIPDTPVILAGVVYIAIVISIVNLMVDILYSVIDPRIKN